MLLGGFEDDESVEEKYNRIIISDMFKRDSAGIGKLFENASFSAI